MNTVLPTWIASISNPSERKMWKNGWKAIREHVEEAEKLEALSYRALFNLAKEVLGKDFAGSNDISYTTQVMRESYAEKMVAKAFDSSFPNELPQPINLSSLIFNISGASHQGTRKYQEDASLCLDCPEGVLAGVFDGHYGRDTSLLCSIDFRERFFNIYNSCEKDLYQTFNRLFVDVQQGIKTKKLNSGSTACIVWIDKIKGYVFTATAADSEAFICRNGKLIPLSCVRDWGSKSDAQRAAIAMKDPSIGVRWPKAVGTMRKSLRLSFKGTNPNEIVQSPNTSRGLGGDIERNPGMTSKPKISMFPYQSGDRFILLTDGFIDDVPPHKLSELSSPNQLLKFVLEDRTVKERDNMTAIFIDVLQNAS